MIRPAIDHLGALNQRPIPLIELKQLSSLLASAYVDLPIHRALQDGAEVAEWVLNMLQIYRLACEILEIMHDYLLSVGHEDSYPVVLGVLL